MAFGWPVVNLASWKFTPAFSLLLLSFLLGFKKSFVTRLFKKNYQNRALLFLGLSVLFSIVPGALSGNSYDFLHNSAVRVALFLTALTASLVISNERKRKILLFIVLISSLILALSGLLEKGQLISFPGDRFLTVNATFNNPNLFAGVLLLYIPLLALFAIRKGPLLLRVTSGISALLSLGVLYLTGCRSALMGLTFSFAGGIPLYLAFFTKERFHKKGIVILVIFVMASGVITLNLPSSEAKLMVTSVQGEPRIQSFSAALKMWLNSPLTAIAGNGPGAFRKLLPQYSYPRFYSGELISSWHAVHNEFLELLVEGGILSFVSFILFLFFLAKGSLLNAGEREQPLFSKLYSLGLFLLLAGFVTDSLFSSNLREPPVAALFYLISFSGSNDRVEYIGTGSQKVRLCIFKSLIPLLFLFSFSRLTLRLYTDRVLRVAQIIEDDNRADALYSFVTTVDPDYIVPPMLQARLRLGKGEISDFFESAQRVEEIIPSFLDIHYLRGQAYTTLSEHHKAIVEYEKHLERGYYDLKAESFLLFSYLWSGQDEKVIEKLQQIMSFDSQYALKDKFDVNFSLTGQISIGRKIRPVITIGKEHILEQLREMVSGPEVSRNRQVARFHRMMDEIYSKAGLEGPALSHRRLMARQLTAVDYSL